MTNNLKQVQKQLSRAILRAKRPSDSVELIAVSKTFPPAEIESVINLGQVIFGESKVQECREKWIDIKAKYPHVKLHLIGSLQTNKVKYLPGLIDAIHTLDRVSLAAEIAKQRAKQLQVNIDFNPICFIQVNTGSEMQKSGISLDDADSFIETCRSTYKLNVVGLMCIPPLSDDSALHFALLKKIAIRNNLKQLSMGMSSDFETAVELGATFVRVGTKIFSTRTL